MLILTRLVNEKILVSTPSGEMTILVMEVMTYHEGNHLANPRVKLGIEAPANFKILREELT